MCICANVHMIMFACVHVGICAHVHACICACVLVCVRACVHVCVHVCMCVYVLYKTKLNHLSTQGNESNNTVLMEANTRAAKQHENYKIKRTEYKCAKVGIATKPMKHSHVHNLTLENVGYIAHANTKTKRHRHEYLSTLLRIKCAGRDPNNGCFPEPPLG